MGSSTAPDDWPCTEMLSQLKSACAERHGAVNLTEHARLSITIFWQRSASLSSRRWVYAPISLRQGLRCPYNPPAEPSAKRRASEKPPSTEHCADLSLIPIPCRRRNSMSASPPQALTAAVNATNERALDCESAYVRWLSRARCTAVPRTQTRGCTPGEPLSCGGMQIGVAGTQNLCRSLGTPRQEEDRRMGGRVRHATEMKSSGTGVKERREFSVHRLHACTDGQRVEGAESCHKMVTHMVDPDGMRGGPQTP